MDKLLIVTLYAITVIKLHPAGKGKVFWKYQIMYYANQLYTTPQHPPVHVRSIHQSTLFMGIRSWEMRGTMPTAEVILLVFLLVFPQNNTSTVMAHNLDWLILTLDQSNTVAASIMCGLLGPAVVSCCTYSQQEYHYTTLLHWQCPRSSQTKILCCTRWLSHLECTICKQQACGSRCSATGWRASRSQEY